jgi:hypothetical protein
MSDERGSDPLDPGTVLSRRRLLRIGGLGTFGMNLSGFLRAKAAQGEKAGNGSRPIHSCILIFYYGGPSHIDTWDMKPAAPREVRGEFRSIATRVPGFSVSEHLPHCAQVADRLAVIRSLHHPMTNHNAAAFATLCGRSPLKGDLELLANDRNDPPCLGSSLSWSVPERPGLPAFVALPHVMHNVVVLPGQTAGFLGSAHEPFQVSSDPSAADFRLGELELPTGVSLERLGHRETLLRGVDRQLRTAEELASSAPLDEHNSRAFALLRSSVVRRAFDLAREDPRVRDRYGRTKHGQSVLLARRLVEAGVRFVTVYDKSVNAQTENWDAHADVFARLRDDLLPPADQALAALVDDLDARGLLESTLVVTFGEFGRTPKVNPAGGRDHWPNCFSAVLAGGGARGGAVYGASDKLGAAPELDPVTPADLAATIFWRFGLDLSAELRDLTDRPYRLAEGRPLARLFDGVGAA